MASSKTSARANWLFVPVIAIGAAIGFAVSERVALPVQPLLAKLGFDQQPLKVGPDYRPPADIALGGVPAILDADTLEIHGERVRLWGIDAPEADQTCGVAGEETRCGQDAAFALADLIAGRVVGCAERARDPGGRLAAVCSVGDTEINGWLVTRGWALAAPAESADYLAAQAEARDARRGVWQAAFVLPYDWRRGERAALVNVADPGAADAGGTDAPAAE